ncbi:MAG: hypothetical protein PHG13_00205 [Candidatus Pacebacteria bacterium]|nr:hypothetical protein [Candidatus Paceibacterota bacterium]MDD5721653.1 hypothetical protein [Candidatus Paceibacterota bacterium]
MDVKKRIVITMVILICLVISLIEIKNTFSFFLKLRDEKDYYIYTEEFVIESLAKETGLIKENDLEFRGIDFYPDPHPYSSLEAFNALENLLKIQEINYVQLRFFLYQKTLDSNQVIYDQTQDLTLESMITMIHQAGKKVSLLPDLIVGEDRDYVASLEPKDINQWFISYGNALIYYAGLAEACGVELFCIGNEFHSLWPEDQRWRHLIYKIKEQYQGLITAKLNCWWQEITFKRTLTLDWLKDLDIISMAPYFDLTKKLNPSLEDIERAWFESRHGNQNIVKQLETIAKTFNQKMIFSEIGYRSTEGTSMEPWNSEDKVPRGEKGREVYSPEEQILATQALFNVFEKESWWAGAFWFYWPTAKSEENDRSWAIWDKPVLQVIQDNFTK